MRKIIAYTTVATTDRNDLIGQVAKKIEIGWQPFGPLIFVSKCYVQPMVIYKPKLQKPQTTERTQHEKLPRIHHQTLQSENHCDR